MNNVKMKLSTILSIIIITLLSTACLYTVFANTPGGQMVSQSDFFFRLDSFGEGETTNGYITFEDLKGTPSLLCNAHGVALPSAGPTGNEKDTFLTGSGGDELDLTYSNDKSIITIPVNGKKIGEVTLEDRSKEKYYASSTYTNRTMARYKITETRVANPREAYILSELFRNVGYPSDVQKAWWTTQSALRDLIYDDEFWEQYQYNIDHNIPIDTETMIPIDYSSGLAAEAAAFEAYILLLTNLENADEVPVNEEGEEWLDVNGQTYNQNGFVLEYTPEWVTNDKLSAETTVSYDQDLEAYKIGPLSIEYLEYTVHCAGRDEVQFAGITNMEIFTDASDAPLKLGEDWEFIWLEGERGTDEDSEFPLPCEEFYIKLNYVEDATKITNIKTDFRYMNAAGEYCILDGEYYTVTWAQKMKRNYTWRKSERFDDDGQIVIDWDREYEDTTFWLEITGHTTEEAQQLVGGMYGDRWYRFVTLNREVKINEAKIDIHKDITDIEGNLLNHTDPNRDFRFLVTVDGAINSGSETLIVKPGNTVSSKVYYWMGGSAPSYSVVELLDEEYQCYRIENNQGTLTNGQTATVQCDNVLENYGTLKIVKEIDATKMPDGELTDEQKNKKFYFDITLQAPALVYNGYQYLNTPVKIPRAEASVNVPYKLDLKWYGPTAPTYYITEVEDQEYDLVSINPDRGSLADDVTSTVTVINEPVWEAAPLQVIKTLEVDQTVNPGKTLDDLFTEDDIKDLKFSFKIEVDGYEPYTVETTALRETGDPLFESGRVGDKYVWKYTSDDFTWLYGKNPNFTITEVNNPEGTHFVSATTDAPNASTGDHSVSGTLTNATNENFVITNNVINNIAKEPQTGKIQIDKYVELEENPSISSAKLQNKDYRFKVKVTGKSFEYKGEFFKEPTTIQLTNDGYEIIPEGKDFIDGKFVLIHVGEENISTYLSEEFKWYGDAPKYEIEEYVAGENVEQSIVPATGELDNFADSNNPNTVVVSAWNKYIPNHRAGSLKIIKKLENDDWCTAEYINSLKFDFKVTVQGYADMIITLDNRHVHQDENGDYIWEYETDRFNWLEEEYESVPGELKSPEFTVEEINMPDDMNFLEVESIPTGARVEGKKVIGRLYPNDIEAVHFEPTPMSYINQFEEKTGNLIIDKKIIGTNLSSKTFEFEIIVRGAFEYENQTYTELKLTRSITGAGKITVGPIKWYGDAPTYTVKELTNEFLHSSQNTSGTILKDENTNVTFVNKDDPPPPHYEYESGHITITKQIENGVQTDDQFTFKVTIDGKEPYYVTLGANETYTSDTYTWLKGTEAPTYSVEEVDLPSGATLVRIDNASGSLTNGTVNVVAINSIPQKQGNFTVTKTTIIDDPKVAGDKANDSFNITMVISGTFEMNGESVVDSSRTLTTTLQGGQSYTSPTITWYGDDAPTVAVTENNLPEGWKLVNISNNNAAVTEEGTRIEVTNRLEVITRIELTIELAGRVWEDVAQDGGKNTPESVPNGKINENESGVEGVQVYIYSNGSLAELKDTLDGVIEQPIITSAGGYWRVPKIKIERASAGMYDIEFVYDGQTYEPTKFLQTSNGDANAYIKASTAERDNYLNDSMALDYDRDIVNNRLAQIKGDQPIDGNKDTVGMAIASNGEENALYYEGKENPNGTRLTSKLLTTDEAGVALDLFKARARTSVGGLQYPFDKKIHMESYDRIITELGMEEVYKYSATYNYLLNINLGLVKRADVITSATKDLYKANVVVSEKLLQYNFNTLENVKGDPIERQIYADSNDVKYEIGVYATDYYYRAEMYQTDAKVYDAVSSFYKTMDKKFDETELEVFLTYKLSLYNQSEGYVLQVNSINDYYESSLGKPIATQITRYIKDENGNGSVTEVANKSYITTQTVNADVNWNVVETDIKGSDGMKYNKMEANFDGIRLATGEYAEIYVTFAVQKDTIEGVQDAIVLGNKANIVEISNYSTFYANGKIAGKVDKDSAPDNINIPDYNDSSLYEDDTDAAPILELKLLEETRTIDGLAWEDSPEDDTAIGNGVHEDTEALIGGLTTQLIEKVKVNGIEYDFLWPTHESLDCLGGNTLEKLTGFDSTTETTRNLVEEGDTIGAYNFTGIPLGTYVVRFLYGNNKADLADTFGITGNPAALNADGTHFSTDENILIANYDGDILTQTAAVYNGHDYKSTIYQAGNMQTDPNGYINNEYHNLEDAALASAKVSDARDSEIRRLEIMANTTTLTNTNGNILATANNKDANHYDLYTKYNMFADTAKIDLNVLNLDGVEAREVVGTVIENGAARVLVNTTDYTINNIDFGLIQRPETAVVLDKQISSIKLITNDERVIFNADYEVSYDVTNANDAKDKTIITQIGNDFLVAEVKLTDISVGTELMQAINKVEKKLTTEPHEGIQNFRFINVDDTILQGTTIKIDYLLTALNVGDIDYTSAKLQALSEEVITQNKAYKQNTAEARTTVKAEILKLANELKEDSKDGVMENYGKYLGKSYYSGDTNGDAIVTTRVRQVVDYVDNNAIFIAAENLESNHSWRNTTITELTGNGYEADRLVDRNVIPEYQLIDKDGISYIDTNRNNVVLSMDTLEDVTGANSSGNNEFEVNLIPYLAAGNEENYKSQIELTISKTVSAQDDADNLAFDNIAEIVKIENAVGRRDEATVPGNANPEGVKNTDPETMEADPIEKGEFIASLVERDASATELITFTPPTGLKTEVTLTTQILLITMISLTILVIGIVIIKKKVL